MALHCDLGRLLARFVFLAVKARGSTTQREMKMSIDTTAPSLASIPQISDETGISRNWFYQRSRLGRLPGMRRFGKHLRIDRDEFFEALKKGAVK
jgi:predicted DNA-binding transcriptional regulator AlpA